MKTQEGEIPPPEINTFEEKSPTQQTLLQPDKRILPLRHMGDLHLEIPLGAARAAPLEVPLEFLFPYRGVPLILAFA